MAKQKTKQTNKTEDLPNMTIQYPGREGHGHKFYPWGARNPVITTATITKKAADILDKGEPE